MKLRTLALLAALLATLSSPPPLLHAQTPVSTIAPTLAKTPPMGWNSWNHFARKVTE